MTNRRAHLRAPAPVRVLHDELVHAPVLPRPVGGYRLTVNGSASLEAPSRQSPADPSPVQLHQHRRVHRDLQRAGSEDARALVLGHVRRGGALGDGAAALLRGVLEHLDAPLGHLRILSLRFVVAARGLVVVVGAAQGWESGDAVRSARGDDTTGTIRRIGGDARGVGSMGRRDAVAAVGLDCRRSSGGSS